MIRETTVTQRQALLSEALEVLEREYGAQLEVDEVARRLATSRRQLQRCFAEHGDGSYRRCLGRIRVQRAAELLRDTHLPVHEVARRVGYTQPAQFAKAFRRMHGVSPTEFRDARTAA